MGTKRPRDQGTKGLRDHGPRDHGTTGLVCLGLLVLWSFGLLVLSSRAQQSIVGGGSGGGGGGSGTNYFTTNSSGGGIKLDTTLASTNLLVQGKVSAANGLTSLNGDGSASFANANTAINAQGELNVLNEYVFYASGAAIFAGGISGVDTSGNIYGPALLTNVTIRTPTPKSYFAGVGSNVFQINGTTNTSLFVTGPGTNNWVALSNGAVYIPPYAINDSEEIGADNARGAIYFASAGDTGPRAGGGASYNWGILNLVHRGPGSPYTGQMLITHQAVALEEGDYGEVLMGNDGSRAGLVRIRYDDYFGNNLATNVAGHAHPLVFQARFRNTNNVIYQALPSIVAYHGAKPINEGGGDPIGNYGTSAAGELRFYACTPFFDLTGAQQSGSGWEMWRMSTNGVGVNGNALYRMGYAEVTLTESSATKVFSVTNVTSGKFVGIKVFACTHADDGSNYQVVSEQFTVSCANVGGTMGTPAVSSSAPVSTFQSSGTLTTTWTAAANGNGIDIKCNAVSSLTQTTLKTKWRVEVDTDASAAAIF